MKIKAAAIRMEIQGAAHIYTLPPPNRHHDIFLKRPQGELASGEQGFVTDSGEFVDRREAYKIAKAAGQLLPEDRPGHTPTPGVLYTEDMW